MLHLSGSGVFATRSFQDGDFLLEYFGQVCSTDDISNNQRKSPYTCFFNHDGVNMW